MWYLFKRLTGFKVNRVLIRVIVFCKCITSATQKYLYKQHDPFSLVKNTVCYNVKNKKPVQCNYLKIKNWPVYVCKYSAVSKADGTYN